MPNTEFEHIFNSYDISEDDYRYWFVLGKYFKKLSIAKEK
jgi:hypothetical protein